MAKDNITVPALVYNGEVISSKDEMLSLTDMWRAAGSDPNKKPVIWLRSEQSTQFVDHIAKNLKVIPDHLVKTSRGGRRPGTWAHWQVAISYAQYLSHEIHAWANSVIREKMISVSSERSRRALLRQQGKDARREFTDVLYSHGVREGREIGHVTNSTYKGLWRLDANGLREKHNLPKKGSIRDHMSSVGLGCVLLSEALAAEEIEARDLRGVDPCAISAYECATTIRQAVGAKRRESRLIRGPENDV